MVDFKPSQVTGLVTVSGVVELSRLELTKYSEVTSVSSVTLTTVLTHTVSATKDNNIALIQCSGQGTAKWQFFIDTVLKGTKRASGGDFNTEWNFAFPLALDASSVLDVKVTHFHTGESLDFEVGMYAFESEP